MEQRTRKGMGIGITACSVIGVFLIILAVPVSQQLYKNLSATHPLLMGFIKFGLLATTGEVFSLRLARGSWVIPDRLGERAFIWGLLGIGITFMMKVFSAGVDGLLAVGFLPGKGFAVLRAFYISTVMNLTFGPAFMAFHKCTDKWLELKDVLPESPTLGQVIGGVDWAGFVGFTLFRTIPLFWIPAHTVTFMLPPEYQPTMAAFLSIALGLILNLKLAKR